MIFNTDNYERTLVLFAIKQGLSTLQLYLWILIKSAGSSKDRLQAQIPVVLGVAGTA